GEGEAEEVGGGGEGGEVGGGGGGVGDAESQEGGGGREGDRRGDPGEEAGALAEIGALAEENAVARQRGVETEDGDQLQEQDGAPVADHECARRHHGHGPEVHLAPAAVGRPARGGQERQWRDHESEAAREDVDPQHTSDHTLHHVFLAHPGGVFCGQPTPESTAPRRSTTAGGRLRRSASPRHTGGLLPFAAPTFSGSGSPRSRSSPIPRRDQERSSSPSRPPACAGVTSTPIAPRATPRRPWAWAAADPSSRGTSRAEWWRRWGPAWPRTSRPSARA